MSTIHRGLTITVTLEENNIPAVNALLLQYRKDLSAEWEDYHQQLPGTFFISWLTLPSQMYADKEKLPARIVLMTSYTGKKNKHLRELAGFLGEKLTEIFKFSPEFPEDTLSFQALFRFLKQKSIPNTFYSGFKFIGAGDVENEKSLKKEILDHFSPLSKEGDLSGLSENAIKEKIENYVLQNPNLNWAKHRVKNKRRNKLAMLFPLILFGMVMLTSIVSLILCLFMDALFLKIMAFVFPVFLLGMVILFLLLRINEKNPHIPNEPISDEKVRQIVALEKNPVLNEMTVIAPLKQGWIRRAFLAVTLRLVALVGYFAYIPTVHTARWLQMDQGKRLVFIANFDNLSEAYAHDFVDSERRSMNMAVIFSHAFGFPATRWLVHKNYNHRSEYMKGVRAHQKITQFWYSFNNELSVENLKKNRKFREGLFQSMNKEEIRDWLLKI
ncbi:MAG: peroxidase [Cyclobacteriaceae bacterium]